MAKKAKAKITQIQHNMAEGIAVMPELAGYVFRWVNPLHRNAKGWGIWHPIERDSELGEAIKDQMSSTFDKFQGMNADKNFYCQGADCILGAATKEAHEVAQVKRQKDADDRINSIDAEELRRNVLIPQESGYKK